MSKSASINDQEFIAKALSRPDLFPEQFIAWLRRFVMDNSLIAQHNSGDFGTTFIDAPVKVFNNSRQEVFRVEDDGSVHITTGTTVLADI